MSDEAAVLEPPPAAAVAEPAPEVKPEKTEVDKLKEKLARAKAWAKDMEAARREEREASDEIEELDAAMKEAKAKKKNATRKVFRLIDEGDQLPLFPKEKKPKAEKVAEEAKPAEEPKAEPAEAPAGDGAELWRTVPIGQLPGITMSQKDKLIACGVHMMGQFEDLRAKLWPTYPDGLLSIKGFGEKAITQLEDSMLEWLRVHGPKVEA